MLHLAELDPEQASLGLAGAWFFGRKALSLVADCAWRVGGEVDLTRVADRVNEHGGRFQVIPVDAWRSYHGDSLDLLELNRIALDRLQTDLRCPSYNGNRIEGRVWIHEQAVVRSSVIVGPTVIGPGARIADAYIGPYTSVGPGAQIEGAEVERSTISAGASIMHIGGRIASSVVGRDARVFRDFDRPRVAPPCRRRHGGRPVLSGLGLRWGARGRHLHLAARTRAGAHPGRDVPDAGDGAVPADRCGGSSPGGRDLGP